MAIILRLVEQDMYNKIGAMFKYPKRAKAFRSALRALNRRFIIYRKR